VVDVPFAALLSSPAGHTVRNIWPLEERGMSLLSNGLHQEFIFLVDRENEDWISGLVAQAVI
jgi:hypothetical protein